MWVLDNTEFHAEPGREIRRIGRIYRRCADRDLRAPFFTPPRMTYLPPIVQGIREKALSKQGKHDFCSSSRWTGRCNYTNIVSWSINSQQNCF